MSGIMDAFAKSISYGLQYGVPLRAFVESFLNMRFEPAGMTDDPDIRFASSIMDYLFRRLAFEYLTPAERAELNILSVNERMEPTLPGIEESVVTTAQGSEVVADPKSIPSASELAAQMELDEQAGTRSGGSVAAQHTSYSSAVTPTTGAGGTPATTGPANLPATPKARHSDAPMCMQCGVQMIRAGSCHACPSCGTTSGCS
jgi:ribonucleoside-diphosphate reductase alpha chain